MPFFMNERQKYELFQQVLGDAMKPTMEKLAELQSEVHKQREGSATKDDVRALRDDIAAMRRDTYNREMVDAKLKDISDDITNLKQAQSDTRKERQQTFAIAVALISTTFLILQYLPNLVTAFSK